MSEPPHRGQACITSHFSEGDWAVGIFMIVVESVVAWRQWSDWNRVRVIGNSLLMAACKRARYRSIFAGSSSAVIFLDMFRTKAKSNTDSLLSGDRS
jgi:hypothetical protein